MTGLSDYQVIDIWCNARKVLMRGYIETEAASYADFLDLAMDEAINASNLKLSLLGRKVLHDSAQKELARLLKGSN